MLHALILGMALARVTPPPTPPPLVPPYEVPAETPLPSPVPVPSATPAALPKAGSILAVSSQSVNLNPAQQRTIAVSGATPPLQAALERRLVNLSVDPNGTSVTVTATQKTGTDVLHVVDADGAHAEISLRVAFDAGTIVPETTLRVTGNPVDPSWLARQVENWIEWVTQVQPGVRPAIGPAAGPRVPLRPGTLAQFTVPVRIAGGGTYFDRAGATVVNVQNVDLDAFAPDVLFYDDDPELLTQDGVLFRGSIGAGQATRLYYYHNADANRRRIVVLLAGESQDPTTVHVVDSLAGPNPDVLDVGDDLTRTFLLTKARNQGVLIDLPQDEPFVFKDVMMNGGDDLAGTLDLRALSGGPVTVTVLAVSPGVDPLSMARRPLLDGDGHARRGVFQLRGYGGDALTYSAGATDDAQLVLGQSEPAALGGAKDAGHDWGDYGVTHTIDVTLSNPGSAPSAAYLYFEPLGGVARGSFLIDGTLVQIGCVRDAVPYRLASFAMAPQQTYHIVLKTMADGGSFYPVAIGVTATPPRPANSPRAGCQGGS